MRWTVEADKFIGIEISDEIMEELTNWTIKRFPFVKWLRRCQVNYEINSFLYVSATMNFYCLYHSTSSKCDPECTSTRRKFHVRCLAFIDRIWKQLCKWQKRFIHRQVRITLRSIYRSNSFTHAVEVQIEPTKCINNWLICFAQQKDSHLTDPCTISYGNSWAESSKNGSSSHANPKDSPEFD